MPPIHLHWPFKECSCLTIRGLGLVDQVAQPLGKAAFVCETSLVITVEGNLVFDLVEEVSDTLKILPYPPFLFGGSSEREGDMISREMAAGNGCRKKAASSTTTSCV